MDPIERARLEHQLQLGCDNPAIRLLGRDCRDCRDPNLCALFERRCAQLHEERVLDAFIEVALLSAPNSLDKVLTEGFHIAQRGLVFPHGRLQLADGQAHRLLHCRIAVGKACVADAAEVKAATQQSAPGRGPVPLGFDSFRLLDARPPAGGSAYYMEYALFESASVLPSALLVCDLRAPSVPRAPQLTAEPTGKAAGHGGALLRSSASRSARLSGGRGTVAGGRAAASGGHAPQQRSAIDELEHVPTYWDEVWGVPVSLHDKMVGWHSRGEGSTHALLPIETAAARAFARPPPSPHELPPVQEYRRALAAQLAAVEAERVRVREQAVALEAQVARAAEAALAEVRAACAEKLRALGAEQAEVERQRAALARADAFAQRHRASSGPAAALVMWTEARRLALRAAAAELPLLARRRPVEADLRLGGSLRLLRAGKLGSDDEEAEGDEEGEEEGHGVATQAVRSTGPSPLLRTPLTASLPCAATPRERASASASASACALQPRQPGVAKNGCTMPRRAVGAAATHEPPRSAGARRGSEVRSALAGAELLRAAAELAAAADTASVAEGGARSTAAAAPAAPYAQPRAWAGSGHTPPGAAPCTGAAEQCAGCAAASGRAEAGRCAAVDQRAPQQFSSTSLAQRLAAAALSAAQQSHAPPPALPPPPPPPLPAGWSFAPAAAEPAAPAAAAAPCARTAPAPRAPEKRASHVGVGCNGDRADAELPSGAVFSCEACADAGVAAALSPRQPLLLPQRAPPCAQADSSHAADAACTPQPRPQQQPPPPPPGPSPRADACADLSLSGAARANARAYEEVRSAAIASRLLSAGAAPAAAEPPFGGSSLLGEGEGWLLYHALGLPAAPATALLFASAVHGRSVARLHALCAGQAPVVLLVAANGHLFGGYAPTPWLCAASDNGGYGSFLFSLSHDLRIPCTAARAGQPCLRASADSLAFGGTDLVLSGDLSACSSRLEHSYSIGLSESEADLLLAGAHTFSCDAVEVWALIPASQTPRHCDFKSENHES